MTNPRYLNLSALRNYRTLLLLGFASGLPLALTAGTLQAWMTVENIDIQTIGFFTLVGQAYVFKFLWAPAMDRYSPSFLGRRRGWMLVTQLFLIASIATMGFLQPSQHLWWLAALAVAVAFFSASQDIIFDAYKTDLLPQEERGTGAAISVLGYRLAMLVSGGLALLIATYVGWQSMYWIMAGMMLIGVYATLTAKEPEINTAPPKTLQQAVLEPLSDFFSRNNAWLILLLIILYKLADAFALSLSTTFLIRGVGFNPVEVGMINKTLGLAATIIGALYGGYLMHKLSLFRALMIFGILQTVSNFGYWILAVTPKDIYVMGGAVFLENICGGMGTAAFVALLMTLCNKSFSATQFALLSALSAVGRVYVGPVAGWLAEAHGWPVFYLFSIVIGLPGLMLLLICRKTLIYTQETDTFIPRTLFKNYYKSTFIIMILAALMFITWLIISCLSFIIIHLVPLIYDLSPEYILYLGSVGGRISPLLSYGVIIGAISFLLGGILDYLALKKSKLA
ncbi:muropeptide MFS transporter AmpG [Xenorhabdus nematophila]|uniref:Anhydromuropeptide permease n=1 Tax=Xenorhabdus nematophila (strain ATCC 19061 / DSM 3370 / CCUG 14189 / LMG 1036 / NCIMB 9965 / AN6) TaxID=406817 RepID=D3VLA0_XENNA|nr:muropeptide MFS transporter AmpG [Xenorhabdus nematophila]CEE91079.1 muropeptide transport protein (MFS family) [Xenorhabdus nematophila str. Anatoliense]CEF31392.1 muropeptide transport protein (MFS family) [Xenorhabdus nematophila str. Websteri]AYA40955.1 muropeptide MFS transporter AmpG [Xenorhabdus nematophila]KHD28112.1 muropeptide transporter [Xenorhabdus nematophila]MBA0019702.1 muropeptide MFS transporter AmpG [Xenorhabdus nematophila]